MGHEVVECTLERDADGSWPSLLWFNTGGDSRCGYVRIDTYLQALSAAVKADKALCAHTTASDLDAAKAAVAGVLRAARDAAFAPEEIPVG